MIILSAVWACGEKPSENVPSANTVSVNPSSVNIGSDATEFTLEVSANCEWGASADDREWLSVSPSGGVSGTSTIKVSAARNTGRVRSSAITIRYAGGKLQVPVTQSYEVQAVTVSDAGFQKALTDMYDADKDGILSSYEAENITEIRAAGYGIKAMPELTEPLFRNLVYIDCSNNSLEELDITYLMKLTHFDCRANEQLRAIHVWSGFTPGAEFYKPETAEYVEPDIPTPAGYALVWQDEFNEGDVLDAAKWKHEVKNSGWVNHELQNYVNGKTPKGVRVTQIKDGALHITALKEDGKVYSSRVYGNVTKGWQYGYVEASINLPSGKGTWPAFWMMPVHFTSWPHDGEIDIMEEVGYHKDYVSSSLHADGHVHSNNTQVTKEVYCKGAEGEFHTYGMEWTPDFFQFYVDGKKTLYYKNPGTGVRDWPYDAPFYVIFNLAWGGDWGGSQGVDESSLPVTMKVDYVRVFQKL